jgi:hypothetical protein
VTLLLFVGLFVLVLMRRRTGLAAIVLAMIPGALIVLVLWSTSSDAASMRVRLAAVRYLEDGAAAGSAPHSLNLSFGGDRINDDFFIARLPEHFVELHVQPERLQSTVKPSVAQPKEKTTWTLRARYGLSASGGGSVAPPGTRGVLAVQSGGGWTLLGELPLQIGDVIRSERQDYVADVVVLDTNRLSVQSQERVLPRLRTKVPIAEYTINTWKVPSTLTRTFSLEGLIKSVMPGPGASRDSAHELDSVLSSFFFFKPGRTAFTGTLHLALLDPSVSVTRAGRRIDFETEYEIKGADSDEGVRIRFYGLGLPNRQFGENFERSGLRDLRSGSLQTARGDRPTLVFRFDSNADSPEVLSFTPSALRRLDLRPEEERSRDHEPRLHVGLVADAFAPRSIAFSILPNRFGVGGQTILHQRSDGPSLLLTPAGQLEVESGRGVWVGDSAQALLQFDQISPSLDLLLTIGCISIAVGALLVALRVSDMWLMRLWVPVMLLLAVRVLLGFRAFNNYPASYKSLALALVSLGFVPWLLLTAYIKGNPRAKPDATAKWIHFWTAVMIVVSSVVVGEAMFAVLVALAWLVTGATAVNVKGAVRPPLARLGVACSGLMSTTALLQRVLAVAASRLAAIVDGLRPGTIAARMSRIRQLLCQPGNGFVYAISAGLFLLAVRCVLVLVGFRERLPLPSAPMAISIVYTPLLLVGYTVLTTKWRDWVGRAASFQIACAWLAFVAFACGGVGFVTSDLGIPLLLIWPLALDGLRTLHHRLRRPWRVWAILAVALATVVKLGMPLIVDPDIFKANPSGPRTVQLTHFDRNKLRLYSYAYPSGMDKIGRRDSDNLAIMHDVLAKYAQAGWSGAGYHRGDVTKVLGPTILREHVPAVFMESDFGAGGVLLLGVLYVLVGASCWRGRRPQRPDSRERYFFGTLGELCFTTFALSSLWMLLANLNLVPFTGKNAYLLGLDSGGDIVESAVLLSLGVFCSVRAQHAPDPAPPAAMPVEGYIRELT